MSSSKAHSTGWASPRTATSARIARRASNSSSNRTMTRGKRALARILSLSLCSTLLPCPAAAEEPPPNASAEAVSRGNEAIALFESGHWTEALARFREAEALYHSPVFVLYAARSLKNAGELQQARESYRRLLDETLAPEAPEAWKRAQSDGRAELAALEASLQPQPVLASSPPPPVVNSNASATAPAATPLAEDDGPYVPGLAVAGTGAAMLIIGGIVGVVALNRKADIESHLSAVCQAKTCPRSQQSEIDRRMQPVEHLALTADILLGVGGAALVTGSVLMVLAPGKSSQVTVGASPRAGFVRVAF